MRRCAAALALLAGCTAAGRWQDDVLVALADSRAAGRELVVYFALAGHEASDRTTAGLRDPIVLAALGRGDFAAVIVDGVARENLYREWIGSGDGMGIAVLDGQGRAYAARPGPQDPAVLVAFLDTCAAARSELAEARAAAAAATATPEDKHRLGVMLLRLGCRVQCEPLLIDAALAGIADARHRLARLYALDGNVTAARRWLRHVPQTPAARVTEGLVLYEERRYADAATVLGEAVAAGGLGEERQMALLYLGKALHRDGRDARAVPVLAALAQEGTGSTFEAAALHVLAHIEDPQRGRSR